MDTGGNAEWDEYIRGETPSVPIREPQKVTLTVTFSPSVLTSEEIALLICEFLNDNQERWREWMEEKIHGN